MLCAPSRCSTSSASPRCSSRTATTAWRPRSPCGHLRPRGHRSGAMSRRHVGFARRRGAERIIARWAGRWAAPSRCRPRSSSAHQRRSSPAVILESPGRRLADRTRLSRPSSCASRIPSPSSRSRRCRSQWARGLTGAGVGDPVRSPRRRRPRATELRAADPHPAQRRRRLRPLGRIARAGRGQARSGRPSQVFDAARHTKLWNYDQERWTNAITDWLAQRRTDLARS